MEFVGFLDVPYTGLIIFRCSDQENLFGEMMLFQSLLGIVKIAILLFLAAPYLCRNAGTPEQSRPARPRSGLDFQIHNVEAT